MIILLVKYNKVINQAFETLAKYLISRGEKIVWADTKEFGKHFDTATYFEVHNYFKQFLYCDAIVIGDIFWQTGQNICKWCSFVDIKCFFLQHGQWIYVENKKNPQYLPYETFFFGKNIHDMCKQCAYAKRSKISVTGTPRYDNIKATPDLEQMYCSQLYCALPVILEKNPSSASNRHETRRKIIKSLKGLDNALPLLIHPHYREGEIDYLKDLFPNAKFADPEADPFPLIAASKCVLTHRDSTTVLDGIAHRKKNIILNKVNSFYKTGYFGQFGIECSSIEEIVDAYNDRTVFNQESDKYIMLGNASERIYQRIKS